MRFGLLLAAASAFVSFAGTALAQPDLTADHLDGTEPLVLDEPLDVVMVRGINYFAEREIADSPNRRPAKWNRDYSSVEAYEKSVEPHRQRLREIIGAADPMVENHRILILPRKGRPSIGTEESQIVYEDVCWDVGDGLTGEGIRLSPVLLPPAELSEDLSNLQEVVSNSRPRGIAIVIPDADQNPEAICGLTDTYPPEGQVALRLAQNRFEVLVPTLINRADTLSGHPDIRYTNMPHREYVYRMAFEMGRHVIGFEVQRVLAAVHGFLDDTFVYRERHVPVILVGIGEGALIAMYAAALEPRIDGVLICGYFQERERLWQEPIYRNVWCLTSEFGDAGVASLIAPRRLVVEACRIDEVQGPPTVRDGRSNVAAPGRFLTAAPDSVEREFNVLLDHYSRLGVEENAALVANESDFPACDESLRALIAAADLKELRPTRPIEVQDPREDQLPSIPFEEARQQRQVRELVDYTQKLLHRSDKARDKKWANVDRSSVEACVDSLDAYRRDVYDNMIGRLPEPDMPLNVRTRKVLDEETHVGYEVMIDCYPAGDVERPIPEGANTAIPDTGSVDGIGWAVGQDWGVIAGGILLLPRDLKEGEQRPVVVCQHGLEGVPMDTITTDPAASGYGPYKGFSTQLVKRGFIVYAPQNPYRGHDAFRVIQRKSNPMGRSLFSYIIPQHQRTITWLASLPFVDRDRIAFYGLSYGGKTAVRVPPMLVPTDDTVGYCLSICSADFDEWVLKNASSEDRYSYVYTPEYEIFEWNMGHMANYAELSYLMTPRPFMVERGHDDGVAPDEWVAWEFAKVKRHYDRLGIGDQTELEVFNGPHTINGVGTFDFLHRHLGWPQTEFKPL